MKKSELIPGVEYAVFHTPGQARRRYGWHKPFKAKLIDVNFSETRYERGTESQPSRKRSVVGIAVDTGEKQIVRAAIPATGPDGKWIKTSEPNAWHATYQVDEQAAEYDYLVLENAGCFLQTWEEYEQEQREQQEWRDEQAAEERKISAKAIANEPDVLASIDRTAAVAAQKLGAFVVPDIYDWRGDGKPERLYVIRGGDGTKYGGGDQLITFNLTYRDVSSDDRILTGAKVEISAATLAKLVGA